MCRGFRKGVSALFSFFGGLYFGLLGLSNPIPPAGGRGRREGVFQLAEGGEESSPSWRLGGSCPRRGADQLGSRGAFREGEGSSLAFRGYRTEIPRLKSGAR